MGRGLFSSVHEWVVNVALPELRMPQLMGPFNDEQGTYGRTSEGRRVPWPGPREGWPWRWPRFKRHQEDENLHKLFTVTDKREAHRMGIKT